MPGQWHIVGLLRLRSVKGVRMFRCNLQPALLEEWPGSFTCYFGNIGLERTPNKSQHTKLTLEKIHCKQRAINTSVPHQIHCKQRAINTSKPHQIHCKQYISTTSDLLQTKGYQYISTTSDPLQTKRYQYVSTTSHLLFKHSSTTSDLLQTKGYSKHTSTSSVQGGIYALMKAHIRSLLSLKTFP